MSKQPGNTFAFGDKVRHLRRPEWGMGSITKVEQVTVEGVVAQRLTIRFENGGLKTISTAHAELEAVNGHAPDLAEAAAARHGHEVQPLDIWKNSAESTWLEPVARRKIEEQMTALPLDARDPFNSLARRMRLTVDLYRFDRTGARLIDWGVAQTGLKDPLTRFSRHDLERLFDLWALERDAHLARLMGEARMQPAVLQQAMAEAPPAARATMKRLNAR